MQKPREALFWHKERGKLVCDLCLKKCKLKEGEVGECRIRGIRKNKIYTFSCNEVFGLNAAPIEEIPVFHVAPGSKTLSVASCYSKEKEFLRKEWNVGVKLLPSIAKRKKATYEDLVKYAREKKCKSISFDYIEPTLSAEFSLRTFKLARRFSIFSIFSTNAIFSIEMMKKFFKYLDIAVIWVFSSLNPQFYKKFGLVKDPEKIRANLRFLRKKHVHMEIVNVIIPEFGDMEEHKSFAEFICHLDSEIPLHFFQFYPTETLDFSITPIDTLIECWRLARASGLRYVYLSNLPEASYLSTYCYNCREVLIKRKLFGVEEINLRKDRCPSCGLRIKLL